MASYLDSFLRVFSPAGFVPRRLCGLWPEWLVWEHVLGNALIWLAYLAIPLLILRLGHRRFPRAGFAGLVAAFAAFIVLCGLGHFLDMLAFFRPMYRLSGHVLVATGLASWWTVWALGRAWPTIMAMRGPAELERIVADRTAELGRAVGALRLAERERWRLAAIVESSDDSIVSEDLAGVVTSWNAGAERIFGYPAAEAIGRPLTFLFPPDRLPEAATILARLRDGERVAPFDSVRLTRDGRRIDVSLTISPILDETGRVVGISKIARDVTLARRGEEALRESEARFRQLADAMPHLVWTAGPDGSPDYYNERWYAYTGRPRGGDGDESWLPVLHPDDVGRSRDTWFRAVATGEPYDVEYRLKNRETGEYRWHQGRGLPVKDASGRVVRWFGTTTDIHEGRLQADALREAEGRQRRAMAAARLAHWEWDLRSDRITYQDSLARLFGRPDDRPFVDLADCLALVHPDDHPAIRAAIDRARIQGVPYEVEHRVLWPDGSTHWLATLGAVVFGADGTPLRMLGVSLDITDRKVAEAQVSLLNEGLEQRVRERTAELKQQARLIDQAHDAIMIRSPLGVISSWNQGAERVYGWSRREALGSVSHQLLETAFPRPRAEIEDELARLGSWEGELTHHRRDGSRVVVATRWVLDRDESGAGEVLEINSDITEEKHAIQRLEASEARTRAILDATVDAIMTIDDRGRLASLNPAAERLFGHPEAELIGQSFRVLIPEPEPEPEPSLDGDVARDPAPGRRPILASDRTVTGRRRDGSTFPMQLAVSEFRLGDRRMSTAIARDITQQQAAEQSLRRARDEAEAAARSKGEFLANMSHEIRTPMNGVIGMTDLLLETRLDNRQRDYAEIIRGSGEALLTVINDILDFSKIAAGKFTLSTEDFDLRTLMEEVADMLAPVAQRKGLEISSRIDPAIPASLRGDPARIRQVLTNLAGNAVKFTERGEVNLEARLVSEGDRDATLQVRVRDTGIGIPEGRLADVFESFTQVEGGSTRNHGGTGLGLTICKSLVGLMGGTIAVESREGEGSTFRFELTLGKADDAPIAPARELEGLRVLVVDDHETSREVLREILHSWGCRPETIGSGPAALALIHATPADDPFAFVLIDHDMPGMDGEMTARAIQSSGRPAGPRLVLLTSLARSRADQEFDESLFVARLSKPIRHSRLREALCRAAPIPGAAQPRPTAAAGDTGPLSVPLRILLAEDNAVNRKVATGLAERIGCRIDVASNGLEALDMLDYELHDVVLMDVQMPVMDGYAATAAIRERELATGAHVPIIAMTANAMQGDRERCLDAGMDGYLTKPLRPGPLREALLSLAISRCRTPIEAASPPAPPAR